MVRGAAAGGATAARGAGGKSLPHSPPRHVPTRPRPLEVVAADAPVHVADFAAQVQAGAYPRFHRFQP
jgi:hypothetical protein